MRFGAIKDLRELCAQYQVALVFTYANNRSLVIAKYMSKNLQVPFDAAYSMQVKDKRQTRKGYMRRW